MTAIYRIRNAANGNFYIGSSVNTRVRFQTHRRQLRKGAHHCQPLQRAWIKWGEECFKFEVVERVESQEGLLKAEDRWLAEHHGQRHCYNVSRHPEMLWLGLKHSDATKALLSDIRKGSKHRLGHVNSPEHREKISLAMKGKPKTVEHVEKIRRRMIGTTYAKDRVVTEQMRADRGRAVGESTQGLEFISVAAAAQHFGLARANLIRTLRNGGMVKRGPHAGLRFQYLEKHALPPTPE